MNLQLLPFDNHAVAGRIWSSHPVPNGAELGSHNSRLLSGKGVALIPVAPFEELAFAVAVGAVGPPQEAVAAEVVRLVVAAADGALAGKHRGFAAWHLLFYALWHRAHVERAYAEGDVWDVLSARR